MAVNLVGSHTQALGTSNPVNLTTGLPLNDGNMLFMIVTTDAAIEFDGFGGGDNGISQTGATWNNLWAEISQTGSLYATSIWWADNISGALDDIQLDDSGFGTGNGSVIIAEFSGVDTWTTFESHLDYDGQSSVDSFDITPNLGDLLVGFVTHHRTDATFAPTSTGFTFVGSAEGPGFGDGESWMYWKESDGSNQEFAGDFTGTVTESFAGIVAFSPSVGPTAVPLDSDLMVQVQATADLTIGGSSELPGVVPVTVGVSATLRVADTRVPKPIGIIEATLDALGEQDAEIGGTRITRLLGAVTQGDTTIFVENVNDWPVPGKVSIDSIVYHYTGRAASSLTGITYEEAGTQTGARQDHRIQSTVLDLSKQFSAVDQVRRALFVNSADGEDLAVIGRNLGVERLPFLADDEQFRNVIKALAYNPKGTVYGIELALDAIVGAGNYVITERLLSDPNTVFITLLGAAAISNLVQGKTFLAGRIPRPAANDVTVTVLETPVGVGGIRWKDEALGTDMRTALPSAQTVVEYEGDPGTLQWTFVGGSEVADTGNTGQYTTLESVSGSGSGYEHLARIQPESAARLEWVVSFSAGGSDDGKEAQCFIRDAARNLTVGFEVPPGGTPILVGFVTGAGNFIAGSTALDNSGNPFWIVTIEKEGSGSVRLLINGAVVQTLAYTSFDITSDHKAGFGNFKSAASSFEIRSKEVRFLAQTVTDYWAARGSAGDMVAPQELDTNEAGFFLSLDVGKQVRISGSAASNPEGGNNNGAFVITSLLDAERVTLDGAQQTDGTVTNPDRFTAPQAIFTYPDDLGKAVVISGSGVGNDGTYVITDLLEEGTLSVLDGLSASGAKTRIAEMSAATFTTEANLDFRVRPVFVAEVGIDWEMSDAGLVSGLNLTMRQPLPITTPGYTRILDVLAPDNLSAHQVTSDIDNILTAEGPPAQFSHYPIYLADPLGFIAQYIDTITAAGVIPEFEVE